MTTFFDVLLSHYTGRLPVTPMCKGLELTEGQQKVTIPNCQCRKIEVSTGKELCAFFKNPLAQWVNGRCGYATHFRM